MANVVNELLKYKEQRATYDAVIRSLRKTPPSYSLSLCAKYGDSNRFLSSVEDGQ